MNIITDRCRICGGDSPHPVEVEGGTLRVCDGCAELMAAKRLDIAIGAAPAEPGHAARPPEWYGASAVWASWDGGRWKRIRYAEVLGRAERRRCAKADGIEIGTGVRNSRPVVCDGVGYPSRRAAARASGVTAKAIGNALKESGGASVEIKGHVFGEGVR